MSASNESGEAIRRLEQHAWRRDVRELESVVVEAMIFARGKWITPEHLGLHVRSGSDAADVPSGAGGAHSWLQREALRLLSERHELRRCDLIASCHVTRKVARREIRTVSSPSRESRTGCMCST